MGNDQAQLEAIQSVISNMVTSESKLKDQIEEAKSWAQVISGSSITQNEIIGKHIMMQLREKKSSKTKLETSSSKV